MTSDARMFVVIFRARVRKPDDEYARVAARMRELAIAEGFDEVALSYWPDEDSISRWRKHPEHLLAQQAGRERWYESYSVQVAQVAREYRSNAHRS